MRIAVRAAAVVVVVSLIMLSAPVSASLIDDAGLAYNGWAGTTYFDFDGNPVPQESDDLEGYVEWVVYSPGDFPAGYSGYTPTAGELVYAYQVFVTGSPAHPVSSLDVAIAAGNPKDNIGSFSGGTVSGDAPTAATLVATVADWDFGKGVIGDTDYIPAIPTGSSSMGLSFSSPNVPVNKFGSLVNGGQGALAIPLPSPSAVEIPEPSMLVMLLFGAGSLILARRRA